MSNLYSSETYVCNYDSDMSVTSDYNYTKYRVIYDVEGYTDPSFAGCYLTFNRCYSNGTHINDDGTFHIVFSSVFGFKEEPKTSDIALTNIRLRTY